MNVAAWLATYPKLANYDGERWLVAQCETLCLESRGTFFRLTLRRRIGDRGPVAELEVDLSPQSPAAPYIVPDEG